MKTGVVTGAVEPGAVDVGLELEEEEEPPPVQLQAKAIVARTTATPRRRSMMDSPPALGALAGGSCDVKTPAKGTWTLSGEENLTLL